MLSRTFQDKWMIELSLAQHNTTKHPIHFYTSLVRCYKYNFSMDKSGLINNILCRASALKETSLLILRLLLPPAAAIIIQIILFIWLCNWFSFRLISIILFIHKLENVFNILFSSPTQKKRTLRTQRWRKKHSKSTKHKCNGSSLLNKNIILKILRAQEIPIMIKSKCNYRSIAWIHSREQEKKKWE